MRIVCPHCDAAYEVPEARLGAARRLRCARCGREWQLEPGARAVAEFSPAPSLPLSQSRPAPILQSAPIVDALDGVPAPASHQPAAQAPGLTVAEPLVERDGRAGRPAPVLAGWGVTVLVLAGLLTAGYVWRGPIKSAWPPSQRAYAAIGLD